MSIFYEADIFFAKYYSLHQKKKKSKTKGASVDPVCLLLS